MITGRPRKQAELRANSCLSIKNIKLPIRPNNCPPSSCISFSLSLHLKLFPHLQKFCRTSFFFYSFSSKFGLLDALQEWFCNSIILDFHLQMAHTILSLLCRIISPHNYHLRFVTQTFLASFPEIIGFHSATLTLASSLLSVHHLYCVLQTDLSYFFSMLTSPLMRHRMTWGCHGYDSHIIAWRFSVCFPMSAQVSSQVTLN